MEHIERTRISKCEHLFDFSLILKSQINYLFDTDSTRYLKIKFHSLPPPTSRDSSGAPFYSGRGGVEWNTQRGASRTPNSESIIVSEFGIRQEKVAFHTAIIVHTSPIPPYPCARELISEEQDTTGRRRAFRTPGADNTLPPPPAPDAPGSRIGRVRTTIAP